MPAPPPFFLVFPDKGSFLRAAAAGLPTAEVDQLKLLSEARLPPVSSLESIALLFGYSPRFIGAMIRRPQRYYRFFSIPSGRKQRTIRTPRIALKVIQRWFGYHLSRARMPPHHVHGFVPGRSTFTAARAHCPTDWLFSIDIRDFFGSVTAELVFDSLVALGYSRQAAHLLTDLCTLTDGAQRTIPQGAPSSPVLANLSFGGTDRRLAEFAALKGLGLTRYADDISVSANGFPPANLEAAIRSILEEDGWQIADTKTRFMQSPKGHPKVLGLLVDQATPRLRKKYRNRLRMMRHMLTKPDLSSATRARFAGHLAYAHGVESAT